MLECLLNPTHPLGVVSRPQLASGGIWASTSQGVVPRRTDLHQTRLQPIDFAGVVLAFRHFLYQRTKHQLKSRRNPQSSWRRLRACHIPHVAHAAAVGAGGLQLASAVAQPGRASESCRPHSSSYRGRCRQRRRRLNCITMHHVNNAMGDSYITISMWVTECSAHVQHMWLHCKPNCA